MSIEAKKPIAEFLGTLVLVLFGCGVAVFTGDVVATALAFGLAIVAMAYVIGPVSGCQINPAVSVGMAINKRISWSECAINVVAQLLGALAGAGLLHAILHFSGMTTANLGQNLANDLNYGGAFLVEVILTFVFVLVVIAVTAKKSNNGKNAGIIIGLTLTLVHLLGITLTGTSVNPARSFGPAIIVMGDAIRQLWIFILAPLVGGIIAALVARFFLDTEEEDRQ
ncbi:MAG: aquaporin [Erysipelotrichales bacterium]|nr:aquaporin [Erysipelotrichales bacterium]